MPSIKSSLKTACISLVTLLFTLSSVPVATLTAYAEDCSPPDSSQAGVHFPTGSDAGTFVYQCEGPYAGKYINDYYVYNPDTSTRSPRYNLDYKYNCDSGQWTMVQYYYAPADGQYHPSRVATSNPGLDTDCPVSAAAATAAGTGSGPGSTNNSNTNVGNNNSLNNSTNMGMNNTITGVATSGNSLVLGNTIAGGATSGNAQDIANVINLLQSTSNAMGGDSNMIVFTRNIDGDVNGDLLLDPAGLGAIQNANTNIDNNLVINNSNNSAINNDINLNSKSGDATVASNTEAGDATSGSAQAIANVVNMVNSALTAGKSFLGVVNINGNLNGDILLPDDFVDQLLAANVPTVNISTTGPDSTNNANTNVNDNTVITNTNNQGITNKVNASASTGSASVSNNTSGGNAKSGEAKTNITAFNLTGSNVIGKNNLLVFVNVLGEWVGLIVNAPQGATAASLGGGISNTGPSSTSNANTNVNNNTTVNNNVNQQINNNITAKAASGNAAVNGNTRGGNAASGDADTAVNLLNVEDSTLDLSGWFGILFINVFGTWNGSFGVNTSAGDPIAKAGSAFAASAGSNPLISFVPKASGSTSAGGSNNSSGFNFSSAFNAATASPGDAAAILAASQNVKASSKGSQGLTDAQNSSLLTRPAFVIASLVVLYILADAYYTGRRRHTSLVK